MNRAHARRPHHSHRSFCALPATWGLLSALGLLSACGEAGDDGFGSGAGGETASGGALGVGGNPETGGATSTGGSNGTGSGGTPAAGGTGGDGAGVGGTGATGGDGSGGESAGGTGGDGAGGTGGDGSGGGSAGGSGGDGSGGVGAGGTGVGGSGVGGSGGGSNPGCDTSVRPAKLEGYGRQTTGGRGGNVVTASTGTQIHAAICGRPADDTPLVILVNGTITPGNTTKQSGSCNTANGVIELKEIQNISLIGVGTSGVLDQIGIHIRSSSNIVIQNLTIKNVRKENTSTPSNGGDAIGMESNVDRIWIDHNEIYGSTTEGEEHDGLIDFKAKTTNVTVSYNHLHDSGRGGLIGSSDGGSDGSTNVTFHHNWYENIKSRTHLIREADAHLYNNYYEKILETGINARNGATLLIENNSFVDSKNPLGTFFYLTNPGTYEVNDNYFAPSVVWQTASDLILAGPNVRSTGTLSVPYEYDLDPVECVPQIVQANAGVGKL